MSHSAATSARVQVHPLETELQHFRAGHTDKRFTEDGSSALEKNLARLCDDVLAGIEGIIPVRKLEAVVLGGGYGRGQGGVLKSEQGDLPYNDLEFYVFLRGNRILNTRQFRVPLDALGERLSHKADLHVEFKVDSLARFRSSPVSMFSYDLVSGHRILFAPDGAFAGCEHHLHASQIPLHEATRLLFNRCTGLLLAKEFLIGKELTRERSDFIGRNFAKAQLALGDVALTAIGQYHWNCLKRQERLQAIEEFEQISWLAELKRHHVAGVEFKLHPQRVTKTAAQFATEHREISELARQLWLWLENRRLRQHFNYVREYALSPVKKCSEHSAVRSLLLNARTFGARAVLDGRSLRYPRERLLNSLPLLLWDEPLNDLKVRRHLQRQLRSKAADWPGFVTAYKSFWPSFS